MTLSDEIIAREKSLLSFEVRSSPAKLKELLSEEFKELGASGAYFELEEVLDRLPQEEFWSAKAGEWEFRLLADNVVQVMYKAIVVKGQDEASSYSYSHRTSIWRIEAGLWKMVYHQGTRVEPFELKV
ncbi:DUF4440 domain-containing protein [Microbulbifer yueqingensis]|uniref:Glyoxylase I family protein n=1 Tax=Microbulbifer yueqingensis TaxID=658219 RepID=A0A1G8XDZ6_9GAMM|nr:DUF4440 domain-containing protein [Microbulbifer yueqingensis]SDJ88701.1 glyoxylase I family protein [Microbulbifer yueqingensis]